MYSEISEELLLTGSRYIKQREYWVNRLSGVIGNTGISIFKKKNPPMKKNEERIGIAIPTAMVQRLMNISFESDITIYIILLAGVKALLHRYINAEDISVISPVFEPDVSDYTLNRYLFIRDRISGEMTFKELLLELRQTVLEAYENQDYPAEKLSDYLSGDSKNGNTDSISTLGCWLENIHGAWGLEELRCDLIFSFRRNEEQMAGEIVYNTRCYERHDIERMSGHYIQLMQQALDHVDTKVKDLSLLTKAERNQLLDEFNHNRQEFPREKRVDQFIRDHARLRPDCPAVLFKEDQYTFQQLNEDSDCLAWFLMKMGVKPEQPVGILLDRSPLLIVSILAVWKAGGAYIPMETDYPVRRIAEIMADSGTGILLTLGNYLKNVDDSSITCNIINLDAREPWEKGNDAPVCLKSDKNGLAYIIYTSGSTGKPKGAIVEHTGMMNHLQAKINDLHLNAESVVAQNASHTFDISVWQFFAAPMTGGKTAVYPQEVILEPDTFISLVIKDRVTVLEVVPSYLLVMLDALSETPRSFEYLSYLVVTGEEIKHQLVKRWFDKYPGIKMVNAYGPTEASDDITHYMMAHPPGNERIPVGKPVQNLNLYILDNNMRPCPIGVEGEICVSGIGVGRGYLNNVEKTRLAFAADPIITKKGVRLYKTGDLGRWIPDGTIEFLGRKDYQVKIRGFRIELGEIESKLVSHTNIKDAAVMAREDENGNNYLCAYVVTSDPGKFNETAIKDYLSEHLPPYMVPAYVVHLEKMPVSPNGKTDRNALPDPMQNSRSIPYISAEALHRLSGLLKKSENTGDQNQENVLVKSKHTTINLPPAPGRFSCYIIGETTLPIECALILLQRQHRVLGLISSEPKVAAWAAANDIPLVPTKKDEILPFLKQESFDYLFSANNSYILPEAVLALPLKGSFNYHNAPLPVYAGSYAPYWALMRGEETHGITWHIIDNGIDTGDIVKQVKIDIDPTDTGFSLNLKCFNAGTRAFEELVEELETGDVTRRKQDFDKRTYFQKYDRPAAGGVISFSWEAEKIDNFIRALDFGGYENPLGTARLATGTEFFILPGISILTSRSSVPPGTIIRIKNDSLVISTASKDIEIRKILYMNDEERDIPEFVNRLKLYEGYRFPEMDRNLGIRLEQLNATLCRHEPFWVQRINRLQSMRLMSTKPGDRDDKESLILCKEFPMPGGLESLNPSIPREDFILIAFSAYVSVISGISSFDIGYSNPTIQNEIDELDGIFARYVPVHVELDSTPGFSEFCLAMQKELKRIRKRKTYARDIFRRYPDLKSKTETIFSLAITLVKRLEEFTTGTRQQINVVIPQEGASCMCFYDTSMLDEDSVNFFLDQFSVFLRRVVSNPDAVTVNQCPEDIRLKGRIIGQVNTGQSGIEPGDIEQCQQCLVEHESITEAVVVLNRNQGKGNHLRAFIVTNKSLEESQMNQYMSKKVPLDLIPCQYIRLEKIPLKPDGTIDRELLASLNIIPEHEDRQLPRNQIEEILAEIWAGVLARKTIGINENFFEIGGDSIKTIQIASRMSKAGYKVEIKDIFKYPTIAALAPFLKKSARIADQKMITGEVPLTPIQKRFFRNITINPHHFNHAVMLYSKEKLEKEAIKAIFTKIQEHHDVLRMTFNATGGNHEFRQVNHGPDYSLWLQEYYFKNLRDGEKALIDRAEKIQASIDLEKGPLMKLGLFHLEDGDRLLIVIHHLVIDGVSWRILFEDIETLYQQYKNGTPLVLPAKTDSFKAWAETLSRFAGEKLVLKEKPYWKKLESMEIEPIKKDFPGQENLIKDTHSLSFSLSQEETSLLLTKVNEAYGTEINDILLTALGLGIKRTTGTETLLVALEGHGREEILEGIDIKRTVGWFTSVFPVVLDLSYGCPDNNLSRQIIEIKETLRRIPNKGMCYGILKYLTPEESKQELNFTLKPQVSFNYLGQFDTDISQMSFKLATESVGKNQSPEGRRQYDLDVSGMIIGQRLKLTVTFNKKQFKPETIETLLAQYKRELLQIISHCLSREQRQLTPCDFTYPGLSIETVSQLQKQYCLEDIYPLTPTQEGMLFQAIYNKNNPYAYFNQLSLRIHEPLEISCVEKSVNELLRRYEILRAIFIYEGMARPIQVILSERKVDFYYADLRELASSAEERAQLARDFNVKDMRRSFDLAKDVLMRVAVLQLGEAEFQFTWSFHHILMDGWCSGILMAEYLEIYNCLRENRTPRLPGVIPFRRYIEWLDIRDKQQSQAYWKNYLAAYEEPVALVKIKNPGTATSGYKKAEFQLVLTEEKTAQLDMLARKNQVTLSVIFQAVWGIILGKYNNKQDVVFGIVVSGRPPEIQGIESMVGLFINAIPVRIHFEETTSFNQLLQVVHESSFNSEAHHYYPLAEIQSEHPLKQDLFDHLLVFENYPVPEFSLAVSHIEFFEQSIYDFNIVVAPGEKLLIHFKYNAHAYGSDFINKIADNVEGVLEQILENEDIYMSELLLLSQEEKIQLLYDQYEDLENE